MARRTVLVTGGSRGLGVGIVEAFLADGDRVATCSRSATPRTDAWAADPAYADRFFFAPVDLADRDAAAAFVHDVHERFGPVDVLVNNAGVAKDGILGTFGDDDTDTVIDLNLKATFQVTKLVVRKMLLGEGGGRIINISSIVGLSGYRGLTVYGATKAALDGFTRALAASSAPAGITVNSVAPGYLRTEMSHGLDEAQLGQIARRTPAGRLGEVEDVANAVRFLAAPESQFITGHVLVVDGGPDVLSRPGLGARPPGRSRGSRRPRSPRGCRTTPRSWSRLSSPKAARHSSRWSTAFAAPAVEGRAGGGGEVDRRVDVEAGRGEQVLVGRAQLHAGVAEDLPQHGERQAQPADLVERHGPLQHDVAAGVTRPPGRSTGALADQAGPLPHEVRRLQHHTRSKLAAGRPLSVPSRTSKVLQVAQAGRGGQLGGGGHAHLAGGDAGDVGAQAGEVPGRAAGAAPDVEHLHAGSMRPASTIAAVRAFVATGGGSSPVAKTP